MGKDDIIMKVYYEPSGFGSRKTTLADARKLDKTITKDDVDNFMSKNTDQRNSREATILS